MLYIVGGALIPLETGEAPLKDKVVYSRALYEKSPWRNKD
jgi:hypothetical protein